MMKAESKISAVCEVISEMNIQIGVLGTDGHVLRRSCPQSRNTIRKKELVVSVQAFHPSRGARAHAHYVPTKG